jgi:hypothetical protein
LALTVAGFVDRDKSILFGFLILRIESANPDL